MMPLSEIFFLGIVFYLLYRFVFNFIIPVLRTTRHVRQQFRNMQDTTQDQGGPFQRPFNRQEEAPQPKNPNPTQSKGTMGDYIDFEEIK